MRRPPLLAVAVLALTLSSCGGGDGEGRPPAVATTVQDRGSAPVPARRADPVAPSAARRLRGPSGRDRAVPILMYHVISAPRPGERYPELWVAPKRFAAHMQALARAGYVGVTLTEVERAWRTGSPLPPRPVVVSFDDGYLSDLTHAAPVLRRLGWPGVLNLEVKNVGLAGGLSRRQVRLLLADGWELASHTVDHLDVTTLDAAGLRREIGGSRARLRELFGVPVRFFCYPAGRYDAAAQAAVRAAGYGGATTVDPGIARPTDDMTALPRVRVNGTDSAASVLARAGGA